MAWDPEQYLRFDDKRLRPGLELLQRIRLDAPDLIYDLGCGAGALTAALAGRWPDARVVGIDSSAEMLARAAADYPATKWPAIEWVEQVVESWTPTAAPALIYSNAALHWLADHETLFPRLLAALAPGGALAVQMPGNFEAPSHRLMEAVAAEGPWAARLGPLSQHIAVLAQERYYDLLAGQAATLDLWHTSYLQVMSGPDPVLEWVRGTALRPYLDALEEAERPAFVADYAARLRAAYPTRADGNTLFPFRRLFLVATAPA